MHELALAEAVITSALESAEREGIETITRIQVRIGELQQIQREVFEFALKELMPAAESRIAQATIEVETESARLRCRACDHAFTLQDTSGPRDHDEAEAIHFIPELAHGFLRCPRCQSPDFEVREGRGVTIHSLEGI